MVLREAEIPDVDGSVKVAPEAASWFGRSTTVSGRRPDHEFQIASRSINDPGVVFYPADEVIARLAEQTPHAPGRMAVVYDKRLCPGTKSA